MKFRKKFEVKTIFNKISPRYDFLNSLLSLGLHKLWKKKLKNSSSKKNFQLDHMNKKFNLIPKRNKFKI